MLSAFSRRLVGDPDADDHRQFTTVPADFSEGAVRNPRSVLFEYPTPNREYPHGGPRSQGEAAFAPIPGVASRSGPHYHGRRTRESWHEPTTARCRPVGAGEHLLHTVRTIHAGGPGTHSSTSGLPPLQRSPGTVAGDGTPPRSSTTNRADLAAATNGAVRASRVQLWTGGGGGLFLAESLGGRCVGDPAGTVRRPSILPRLHRDRFAAMSPDGVFGLHPVTSRGHLGIHRRNPLLYWDDARCRRAAAERVERMSKAQWRIAKMPVRRSGTPHTEALRCACESADLNPPEVQHAPRRKVPRVLKRMIMSSSADMCLR